MRKIILLVTMGILVVGCASTPPHRAAFYERTGGEKVTEAVGSLSMVTSAIGVSSVSARYLRVYPECVDRNTSQMDLWTCVQDIDVKEGRVKGGQRVNLDDVMAGK
jgi:hypothetical protein